MITAATSVLFFTFHLLSVHLSSVAGHGFMSFPNVRGALNDGVAGVTNNVNKSADIDYYIHYPAGDKRQIKGAGKNYQKNQYKGKPWVPFNPTDRSFVWRSGVCGDRKENNFPHDHLRGGKFYNNAQIVADFAVGGVIDVTMTFNAHHNGFFQLYVCDVSKCGGEINENCFRNRHCQKLLRARNKKCDSNKSKQCGPIDRNYPERWYLPCESAADKVPGSARKTYGKGTILYQLPKNLRCDHCVLHWYWTSANNCNPPGVREYFTGLDRPKAWDKTCKGQANARGGYSKNRECGEKFPEEYYLCSDIRIGKKKPTSTRPYPTVTPTPSKSNGPKNNKGRK